MQKSRLELLELRFRLQISLFGEMREMLLCLSLSQRPSNFDFALRPHLCWKLEILTRFTFKIDDMILS